MKVICIDGKPVSTSIHLPEGVPLEVRQGIFNEDCYIVKGYELCPIDGANLEWRKCRFIPLSTIDETELLHNRQTELA